MPAGGPRRGRRDNGLSAAAYAIVGDIDPRVGEHLLDVLGASGIAAYLQPSADLHPVTRTTTLPARPTDRLYADREHLDTAKDYFAQLTSESAASETLDTLPRPPGRGPRRVGGWGPSASAGGSRDATRRGDQPERAEGRGDPPADGDPSQAAGGDGAESETSPKGTGGPTGHQPTREDIDAVFASIVAEFDAPTTPENRQWPSIEELPSAENHPGRRRTDRPRRDSDTSDWAAAVGRLESFPEPSLLDGLDTFGANLPGEEDEGYTPPPPPPLPRISRAATGAILAIVAGLVLFFWPSLLPIRQTVVLLLGFVAVLGGFVALVWRLKPGGDDEDDAPDDGARV